MPKVQLFNTQTEQSDIKKRTYVSKETVLGNRQHSDIERLRGAL